MKKGKIFIQIASYRDPQLITTIESEIQMANSPQNLVFSIARQFHENDEFDNLDKHHLLSVLTLHLTEFVQHLLITYLLLIYKMVMYRHYLQEQFINVVLKVEDYI